MFKNILVPLDGSDLAETALTPAASLATTLGASIMLLHVIEKNAPHEVHHDRHLTKADEADVYLRKVAERAFPVEAKVETHVHTAEVRDVAASIVEHTGEFNPDLVVMCAHGKSGFRALIFGGIAQQVLAADKPPVLLLQSKTAVPHPFVVRRILVPLDSESFHDDSLPYAQELAKAYDAELYLLTVIPTFSTMTGEKAATSVLLPTTAMAFLDIQEQAAKEHLQVHLAEFYKTGYKAKAEVARGDPASSIAETASRVEADLILLSTHRKAGINAFWARSVTPNVMKKTQIPLLLVPLGVPRQ